MSEIQIVPLYPSELLSKGVDERMRYFLVEAVVDHPMLTEKLDSLDVLTVFPTSRNLVLVIGGTGVGKTTLLRKLNDRINNKLSEIAVAAGLVGSVYVELRTPKKGSFDFSVLHREILVGLGAPLVGRTRPVVMRSAGDMQIPTLLVERDIAALRGQALEERFFRDIRMRSPRAILIDEAAAIFKTARPRGEDDRLERLKTQADIVKGIATHAESSVVLGGAYDFFDLSLSSGQNARRSSIIHVEPYSGDEKGIAGFVVAVTSLLCHLPTVHSIDPVAAATELLLQGLGCIGIAAGILAEALREAIVTSSPLTIELVRKYYYPKAALDVMRCELEEGRRRVNAFLTLEELLPAGDGANSSTESFSPSATHRQQGKRRNALKPGDTKPDHMAGATSAW